MGDSPKWIKMVGLQWNILLKWMISGYPHFRKRTCGHGRIPLVLKRGLLENLPCVGDFPIRAVEFGDFPTGHI